jgi:serine/threonine protein kinase
MTPNTTGLSTIDEGARRQFEAAWRAGQPEPIERFLPVEDDPCYLATLEELVHIELEMLWKAARRAGPAPDATVREPPRVEAYLARFPRLNQPAIAGRLLQQERLVRHRCGDQPSPEEYRCRFPGLDLTAVEGQSWPSGIETDVPQLPVIPGYQVLGVIARGGMGVVYRARQLSLNRTVAIKMILAADQAGPEELARFQTEAEAVARLQHPNIVQIFEVGTHQGRPYLALEYIDGGSLAQHLAGQPQAPRRAAGLVETLARAMHTVHQCGIVHRDLKPANILLSVSREPLASASAEALADASRLDEAIPKISDFGLAKRLEAASLTQSGAVVGTPSYMAPEQAAGRTREIGPLADVYALGAILYEMITGRPPFRAETAGDTVLQVLSDDPVSPVRFQPKMPRDLETICLKCLHKIPSHRYVSAEALAEDLRRFLAGEPIQARPVGLWERGLKWARRRPAVAALLAVASVVLLGLMIGGFWYNARLQAEVEREQERTQEAERQRAETQEQRRLADANFRLACEAVDGMVTRVAEGPLARMPQMEQERRRVLEHALQFYQQFLKQRSTDPVVRQQTARASWRLGDIRRLLGRNRQADQDYCWALALQKSLTADYPGVPAYWQDLAKTHTNRGHLLGDINQPKEAEKAFRQALAIRERLASDFPREPDYRQELADAFHNLGTLFSDQDRYPEAEKNLTRARHLQEKLIAAYPDRHASRAGLARTFTNLGLMLRVEKHLGKAEQAFRKAIQLKSEMAAPLQKAAVHRFDLANSYNHLGLVLYDAEQYQKAEAAYRKAYDLQENLAKEYPSVPDYQSQLGGTLHNWADVLKDWKRPAAACQQLEQAIRHQRAALRANPRHPGYREFFRFHCYNLAELLRDLRQPVRAVQTADQVLSVADSGEEPHFAAAIRTQCIPLVEKEASFTLAQRQWLAEAYGSRAVELLRDAFRKGYKYEDKEKFFKEFAPLGARRDFQKLLAELGPMSKPTNK